MNFSDLLTGALGILALATAAGYGLLRGRVTALRDELKDEREGRAADRRDRDEARNEVKQLRTDLNALTRVVTGEVHWVAIGAQLGEHHTEARAHWHENERIEREQLEATQELLRELRKGTP